MKEENVRPVTPEEALGDKLLIEAQRINSAITTCNNSLKKIYSGRGNATITCPPECQDTFVREEVIRRFEETGRWKVKYNIYSNFVFTPISPIDMTEAYCDK